jgi:hypothetical protein
MDFCLRGKGSEARSSQTATLKLHATERDRSQPAFPLTIVQRLRARRLS